MRDLPVVALGDDGTMPGTDPLGDTIKSERT